MTASGSFPRIVVAAAALVKERLHAVLAEPRWEQFAKEFPQDALALMRATAVRLRRDVDAPDSTKRPRLG